MKRLLIMDEEMTLLDAFALDQIITLCMDVVVVVNSRTRVRRPSKICSFEATATTT